MLRSNFVVVAGLVEEQDGHLLVPQEKARTAEFKVEFVWCHACSKCDRKVAC